MNTYKKIRGLLTEARGGGRSFQPRVRTSGGKAAHGVSLGRDEQYLRANVERLRAMADRAGRPYSPVLQAMIERLAKNPNPDAQTKSQENQSTEINMDGYERIYEMFINEVAGGTPSHKAPGHAERMEAHKKRIRSHPEFSESNPKKVKAGKSGGRPSKKATKQEADTLTQQFRGGTVSQQRGK